MQKRSKCSIVHPSGRHIFSQKKHYFIIIRRCKLNSIGMYFGLFAIKSLGRCVNSISMYVYACTRSHPAHPGFELAEMRIRNMAMMGMLIRSLAVHY